MKQIWKKLRSNFLGLLFLRFLSCLYGLGFWFLYCWRTLFVKVRRLSYPVVSVGNLTVGGTGKTTFCSYLSRSFLDRKYRVCVLTRGYKGGDEAQMLKKEFSNQGSEFSILAGKNRLSLALDFLSSRFVGNRKSEIENQLVFILDDGHQHHPIAKDVNIVLINATDEAGLSHLMPLGLLREPLGPSLRRADCVILTHADLAKPEYLKTLESTVQSHNRRALIFRGAHEPTGMVALPGRKNLDLKSLDSSKVVLFSGVGNPEGFELMVSKKLGAHVLRHFVFEDHAPYSVGRLGEIVNYARQQKADYVLTTAKDAARLVDFVEKGYHFDNNLCVVEVGFEFLGDEEKFWSFILAQLKIPN